MDLTALCKCNSQKHKCMKEGRVCTPIVHLLCSQSVDIFVHLTVLSALVSFHTEETQRKPIFLHFYKPHKIVQPTYWQHWDRAKNFNCIALFKTNKRFMVLCCISQWLMDWFLHSTHTPSALHDMSHLPIQEHIHTHLNASECTVQENSGQTGAARDWTINLAISKSPAPTPESQPPQMQSIHSYGKAFSSSL